MKSAEKSFKLVPYPKTVEWNGKSISGIPYCQTSIRGIKTFLAQQGTIPVTFTTDPTIPEEGYRLEIGEKIEIRSSGYAGSLYAVIALRQLCDQFGEKLPMALLCDTPVMRHRGAQVSYAQINVAYKVDWLKKHIIELAKIHINYLYLYLEWDFAFPSLPPVCPSWMMTPEDAREIVAFASDYNVCIIPECNVLGHTSDFLSMQRMNDLKENMDGEESPKTSDGLAFCPNNPKTVGIVFRALDDLIDAFSPPIIHIGGDEVYKIGRFAVLLYPDTRSSCLEGGDLRAVGRYAARPVRRKPL